MATIAACVCTLFSKPMRMVPLRQTLVSHRVPTSTHSVVQRFPGVALLPDFQASLSAPSSREINPATGVSPWGKMMSYLKNFLKEASEQLSSETAATVFIDSNPSMTIWTQVRESCSSKHTDEQHQQPTPCSLMRSPHLS